MTYDFETRVDRKGTGAKKWDQMLEWNPNVSEDVIPLSVADMEFKNAPEIIEGLQEYLNDAVLGYTVPYDSFLQAVVDWQQKRHNWTVEKGWIVNTPGVVAAIYAAIRVLTEKDDGVMVFRPVYYPFVSAITDNDRTEVNIPLINQNGHYVIDFDAFEKAASKPQNKLLILCSPHNPVGRVWTKEELTRLADICVEHDIYVVSDEVWYDVVMPGNTHTVLHTVNEKLTERLITCTAPSKTFNLAGLVTSNIFISNPKLREAFVQDIQKARSDMIGTLGYKGCELAYTQSEEWLDELITVIDRNQTLVHDFFNERFPQIKAPKIEGTYVQWLDFRELGLSHSELEEFLHMEAEFFTNEGYVFGTEGSGFERVNVALPTDALEEALERLGAALENKGF